ncbi:MFS transporter [Effusibacillus dendaii]|uniref:Major facilitator superfamily (MFS) profile domain-containing protein n=1 Tax=Effusibacillus dendaii TaxID=2743772 RepID=A0A7I8D756_9BACL|nr:MFS transporter [Effusibacillus dendaii]BCJ85988.1 hypothetical protein skT53_09730 [Effusibacillus dendaii]
MIHMESRIYQYFWLSNFLIFTTFYALIAILPAFVIDVLKGGKEQIGPVMTSFILAYRSAFRAYVAAHTTFPVMFSAFSIFSLLAFLFGCITRVPVSAPKKKTNQRLQWKNFVEPNAIPISIVGMVLSFAYSGLLTFVPVYAKAIGLDSFASYFFIIYALIMIISRPFTGKLFDRRGEHYVVYPSIFLYFIGLICLSQSHSAVLFLVSGAIYETGIAIEARSLG